MGRKYKCIYCNESYERDKLVSHIEKKHEEMLNPDSGFTANRVVFDIVNKKQPIGAAKGSCRECHQATKWNEKIVRYDAYCSDKCRSIAREKAVSNMIRVYNKPTLLNDEEHQERMLANRRIAGKYKWSDGTYKTYVGTYEKKFLEFCDNVLGIESKDLVTPGPTFRYEYNGEEHTWITDAWYLPYNLVFDIKDGGSNKNNREMPEYRNKQIAKEKMITDLGEYNYIRLTDNQFVQLLEIFAELKMISLDTTNNTKTISRIHESLIGGALPPVGATDMHPHPFIINYDKKDKYMLCNDIVSDCGITVGSDSKLKKVKTKEELKDKKFRVFKYVGTRGDDIIKEVYNTYKTQKVVRPDYLAQIVSEMDNVLVSDQLLMSDVLKEVNITHHRDRMDSLIESLLYQYNKLSDNTISEFVVLAPDKYEYCKSLLEGRPNVRIVQDLTGKYYGRNSQTQQKTKSVSSLEEITSSMLDCIT